MPLDDFLSVVQEENTSTMVPGAINQGDMSGRIHHICFNDGEQHKMEYLKNWVYNKLSLKSGDYGRD